MVAGVDARVCTGDGTVRAFRVAGALSGAGLVTRDKVRGDSDVVAPILLLNGFVAEEAKLTG